MKKVFVIAEIGNTHVGSLGLAKCMIRAAADCGADAVKFQTHIFEAESLTDAPSPPYFKDESRRDYFERTAFAMPEYEILKRHAEGEYDVEFISSPFSLPAVDLLEGIGIRRYKIPSGEVTNTPLLEKVAGTEKPVLLSSGMSTWNELDNAVQVLRANGCGDITVLQCTSIYPCPPEKVGLNVLLELKSRYDLSIGFSDHTLGFSSAIGAAILGADVIEKHFTLSRQMYGSDAKHSLEPNEFKLFVEAIREIEKVIDSNVSKDALAEEVRDMKTIFEKSIVAKRRITKGTELSLDTICFKKPGDGIRADRYGEVLGKVAKVDIVPDTKIGEEMLE